MELPKSGNGELPMLLFLSSSHYFGCKDKGYLQRIIEAEIFLAQ